MCGIAGFVGAGSRRDIESMTGALAHRGPDGEGFYTDDSSAPVFLGHRRLAIVDLLTGDQPMWSADGQTGIVFNGEIYNHVELRAASHPLWPCSPVTDHSDTEVLIHGYRESAKIPAAASTACLPSQFTTGFAGGCFLRRDRFGEKPLHLRPSQGLFLRSRVN